MLRLAGSFAALLFIAMTGAAFAWGHHHHHSGVDVPTPVVGPAKPGPTYKCPGCNKPYLPPGTRITIHGPHTSCTFLNYPGIEGCDVF
jgi:hypothetical protein